VSLIAASSVVGTVRGMVYPIDLTDEQWALLEPVFHAPATGPQVCR
jgi:hypothetical protein